ncbi:MAG TPA: ATP-dependent RNA helicase HrpA [Streptosporangiaceae bacterium]|nr:ATP-dependent RNA helicase HrpA [Streptosporangiaceae bacterium]
MRASLADLRSRLPDLMLLDQRRLRQRVEGVRKITDARAKDKVVAEIAEHVAAAERRVAQRRATVPALTYPPELPVAQRKDEILAAVRDHQVVIVAGETGSGKTTQLPKICLELGRGVLGTIGHTQPRRLAARTVAERIAEELGTEVGGVVGWKVRFTDQVGDRTLVKLMTDGILLTELQHDRMLRQYDTLIIDEAHERSLNIDFILGHVKQLLPRRPDLKVIITSATIDPERFSRHFADAPIVEVSGRTYPVEVRYRPLVATEEGEEDRDQVQAIGDAVGELIAEGPGDILVFLSGEREIRDTADALGKMKLRDTEVLPLFARLSAAEQHRVFRPHRGRRIVLATNVAETSLTVPGIKYVIDPGTARISRYSHRTKVQRLPIEAISQASANQRKGRCGRTSDGICVRLYAEDDFAARPEFTDPEILRTNLASVILQMKAARLGDIETFPFIDPPDRRNIKDGLQLLHELGALAEDGRITRLGRTLVQFPIDPRLARMIVEAGENGCVREVLVIVAALSIQDPRERPADRQQAADEKHRRFADPASDFLAYLNLWRYLREQQQELSGSQFRRLCKTEFLHYLRVREWQDLYTQLRQVASRLGITLNRGDPDGAADPDKIHISLLAGLLSHIGLLDPERREYDGARGAKFAIFPGSALFKKPPRWVMSAELVETSRLWARVNARIQPEWVEPLAGHLVKRGYSEPHWEKARGAVMAVEKVTLYGVPIVAARTVNYGGIDPRLSRELFIRQALVEGDWDTRHRFFHDNRRLLAEVEELEHRARRRDILVDDETLFDFYDRRVPADVVSARHFDSWWKKARAREPGLLTFDPGMLVNATAGEVSEADYPDFWLQDGLKLRLTYRFEPGGSEPGAAADGVTAHIPLSVLNQVRPEGFDWQIAGLREDLVTELIRSLPKAIRRSFVPAPNFAAAVLRRITPRQGPILDAVARELRDMGGPVISRESWDLDRVPDHLKITFRVVDGDRTLAEGKDLTALKQRLAPKVRATLADAGTDLERRGLREWTIGTLPRSYERGGMKAYPSLVDEGDSVAVRMLESAAEQDRAMWRGTRRLLLLNAPSPMRLIQRRLTNQAKLALGHNPHGSVAKLFDDCFACAADRLMAEAGGPAWDEAGFTRLNDHVRAGLHDAADAVVTQVERVLTIAHAIEVRLKSTDSPILVPALADIRAQLAALVYPGFVTATGWDRLPHLVRYLRAIERRLDRLPDNPGRDRDLMRQVQTLQADYESLRDRAADGAADPGLRQIRWMLEELRVSFFAQQIGTAYPVSEKRIRKAMAAHAT